jgi:hypothetical protein
LYAKIALVIVAFDGIEETSHLIKEFEYGPRKSIASVVLADQFVVEAV